ncbi:MAG TPA: hypothetical protein VJ983_06990 [candidate division Zixibacteria bacterium]|nr:hypothetical protein [candidate division Zixibacteria bacterium]
MSRLRAPMFLGLCLLLGLFYATATVGAMDFEEGDQVHITNLHRIPDDLYIWASTVTMDGIVEGDLCVGAYEVNTNGQVKASANIFANEFRHTGKIDGTLRCFANSATIDGYIGRSILMFGNQIHIGDKAVIEREVRIQGNNVIFDGTAKDNVWIKAKNISLSGTIGGDVYLEGEKIHIIAPATIKGNLTYVSKNEASIGLDSGVTVVGKTSWELPREKKPEETTGNAYTSVILKFSKLLAAFLFGIILMAFSKQYMVEATNQLKNRFSVAAATGLLALVIFILCVIVLIIASILILVGIALLSGHLMLLGALAVAVSIVMIPITSVATVCGGVIFYTGKIVFALFTGYFVVRAMKKDTRFVTRWQLLLGLVILTIAFWLPYVGILLYVVISLIGAGGIILGIKHCRIQLSQSQDVGVTPPPPPPGPIQEGA